MDIISVSVTLFLIMDPFGNLPIFLPILERVPEKRRRAVLVRELMLALVVIAVFIFAGRYLLGFLGIKEESVSIAGGIILFLIAVRMIFPAEKRTEAEFAGEPLLVPIAIPLTAGPSLLAVLLLFSTGYPDRLFDLLVAALIAWGATFIILFSSTFIARFLRRRGLVALERLMGMVLVALAVQLFLDGVTAYLG
jgi:MarC family membrane protein